MFNLIPQTGRFKIILADAIERRFDGVPQGEVVTIAHRLSKENPNTETKTFFVDRKHNQSCFLTLLNGRVMLPIGKDYVT